jgi:hypothetical protein
MTTEYLIRINYKSGIQEEVWVTEFSIKGGSYSWNYKESENKKILQFGADSVESVYQLDARKF